MRNSDQITSAPVRRKTLRKLHEIQRYDRGRKIADVIDLMADEWLARLSREPASPNSSPEPARMTTSAV